MNVGFIGLGNVGSKLAGSLLRNGFDLTVRDLDREQILPADKPAIIPSSSSITDALAAGFGRQVMIS